MLTKNSTAERVHPASMYGERRKTLTIPSWLRTPQFHPRVRYPTIVQSKQYAESTPSEGNLSRQHLSLAQGKYHRRKGIGRTLAREKLHAA